ncbi:hypothetical protein MD484_g7407, partial [Candolleomyces efflorescens]
MQRIGSTSENRFVDVGAAFLEQARREGLSDKFKVAWVILFSNTFPHRAPLFIQKLLKDMAWQTFAWGKTIPKLHWTEWCTLAPEERDWITDQIFYEYKQGQRGLVKKSTDELFGVPGSCKELAIDVDK